MKSSLTPDRFQPGSAIPLSVGMHLALLAAVAAFGSWEPAAESLIRPEQVTQVSLVSMPKQTTRLPQKEMKRPDPPKGKTPKPAPKPPPPTASDMVEHVEEAPETQGVETEEPTVDRSQEREKLLRDLRRQQALDALVPDGPKDQAKTDPNGVEDAVGSQRGIAGDPRIAAYQEQVRAAAMANFSAIQTDAKVAVVQVTIDARGNILNSGIAKTSGDTSFDAAARTAVRRTGRVPPPPADLMPGPTATFFIRLSNAD
ncbi:MAG: energy transducer TonB [Myxococcota bacterium]|nr:energy transducer TonB [Myxococcota bacterium]